MYRVKKLKKCVLMRNIIQNNISEGGNFTHKVLKTKQFQHKILVNSPITSAKCIARLQKWCEREYRRKKRKIYTVNN